LNNILNTINKDENENLDSKALERISKACEKDVKNLVHLLHNEYENKKKL
jgi:hypothetical protein